MMKHNTALNFSIIATLCSSVLLTASPLGEAMERLKANPGLEDLPIAMVATVTGFADGEDYLIESEGAALVLDTPRSWRGALSVGSLIEIRGELELEGEWAHLGIDFEVDADSIRLLEAGEGATEPTPTGGLPEGAGLGEAMELLRANPGLEDLPIAVVATVTGFADDEDYLIESEGAALVLDTPRWWRGRLEIGDTVGIRGELERDTEWAHLGVYYEIDAYSIEMAGEATEAVESVINDTLSINEITDGWLRSAWLGWVHAMDNDALYHPALGRLYITADTATELAYIHKDEYGWLISGAALYPHLYSLKSADWYYNMPDSDWFYDYTEAAWSRK